MPQLRKPISDCGTRRPPPRCTLMSDRKSHDFDESERKQPYERDGLLTQRLALLAVFLFAVIAVLTFAYVL